MVSVVIPTHDREHLVGRAIESVLAQSYSDWECIVVDDASVDCTERVVRGFDDPRIQYLRRDEQGGGAAARNTGIRQARGRYVAFLDSDDEWLPHKLERQIDALGRSDLPDVALVYTGSTVVHGGYPSATRPATHRGDVYETALRRNIIAETSRVMVAREALLEVGGFDERLPASQDFELWIRIAARYPVECVPEALVRIHRSDRERRITSDSSAVSRARDLVFTKHRARYRETGLEFDRMIRLGVLAHGRAFDRAEARRWYRGARRVRPWNAVPYCLLGATLIPQSLVRLLVTSTDWMRAQFRQRMDS